MKIRFWLLVTSFWFSLYGLLLADDFYKGKTVRTSSLAGAPEADSIPTAA